MREQSWLTEYSPNPARPRKNIIFKYLILVEFLKPTLLKKTKTGTISRQHVTGYIIMYCIKEHMPWCISSAQHSSSAQRKRQWAQPGTGLSSILKIRKNFCTVHVTEHWHKLPTEAVESPSLEIFISCLDMVLGNLFCAAMLEQGLDQMNPEVPASLKRSVVLCFPSPSFIDFCSFTDSLLMVTNILFCSASSVFT